MASIRTLLLLPIALLAGVALVWPIFAFLGGLPAHACPSGWVIGGPTGGGQIMIMLPLIFGTILPAMLIAEMVAARLPSLRRLAAVPAAGMRARWSLALWIFLALLPISLLATTSYACVTPQAVIVRRTPWSDAQVYGWRDVRAVVADCHHRGRINRNSYQLVMRDGEPIDIAVATDSFVAGFPAVARALHGRSIDFNGDATSCPAQLRAIFAVSPAQ